MAILRGAIEAAMNYAPDGWVEWWGGGDRCLYCGKTYTATTAELRDEIKDRHRNRCFPHPVGLEREGWDTPPAA